MADRYDSLMVAADVDSWSGYLSDADVQLLLACGIAPFPVGAAEGVSA